MKTRILLCVFAIGLSAPVVRPGEARQPAQDMAAVDRFLDLSNDELDQLQQVIARIRAMSPEERAALRVEIEKFRKLPADEREHLRKGWGWMPAELQDAWREMMRSSTPERRAAIQKELQSLDPAGKAARRRALAEAYLKSKETKPDN